MHSAVRGGGNAAPPVQRLATASAAGGPAGRVDALGAVLQLYMHVQL